MTNDTARHATGSDTAPGKIDPHAQSIPHIAPIHRQRRYSDSRFQLHGLTDNPLCDAAWPLFGLAIHLRALDSYDDITRLYQSVQRQISAIIKQVSQLGYDASTQKAYSYTLCVLMDEAVMSTQWGRDSTWSQHSLLSAIHQETWGGEKFFSVLARMSTDTPAYRHALEFMYLCLCMGLKGKYSNQPKGDEALQRLTRQLHLRLQPFQTETPKRLTEPMRNVAPPSHRVQRQCPTWIPWTVAITALAAAYTIYGVRLHAITQQVLISLDSVLML